MLISAPHTEIVSSVREVGNE